MARIHYDNELLQLGLIRLPVDIDSRSETISPTVFAVRINLDKQMIRHI